MTYLARVAAQLRGATRYGTRLPVVRFLGPQEHDGPLFRCSRETLERDIHAVKDALRRCPRTDEGIEYPATISIAGLGSFALSDRFACQQGPWWFRPPMRESRAEVVRDKIVLIVGAGQGFGAALARLLAADGALLLLADRNQASVEHLANDLSQQGRPALALRADISVEEDVRQLSEEVSRYAGGLDLLLFSAGVVRSGPTVAMSSADFDLCTKVNYRGYFLLVKYLAPLLIEQATQAGNYFTDIIQINSKSGLQGSFRNAAYAGSKFGGMGLTQSFALEFIAWNIKFNAICPGNYLDGPMWSAPETGLLHKYLRDGKVPGAKNIEDVRKFYLQKVPCNRGCLPEDIVKTVYYILEQNYETGQALPVTGGQVMLC